MCHIDDVKNILALHPKYAGYSALYNPVKVA